MRSVSSLVVAVTALVAAGGMGGLAGCATPMKPGASMDAAAPRDAARADASDDASPPPLDMTDVSDAVRGPDLMAPPPDLLGVTCMPKTTPCDIFCQNCGAGGKCSLDGMSKPACYPTGPIMPAQQCGKFGGDDCVPGSLCITESSKTMYSTCHPYCRTDVDCTDGGKCVYPLTIGGMNTTYKVCSDPVTGCDPVKLTGCSGALGCYSVTPDGQTGCHAAGTGAAGAACDTDYDCQSGYECAGMSGAMTYQCHRACSNAAPACPSGTSCFKITGHATWGVCA